MGPFASSTSANVPVTVKLASGLGSNVLISSSGVNSPGPGVQFVVTVNVDSGHPSGTVTLLEDNAIVGVSPVSATTGQAYFSVTINGSALHSINASTQVIPCLCRTPLQCL